jgi:hypothetical protein
MLRSHRPIASVLARLQQRLHVGPRRAPLPVKGGSAYTAAPASATGWTKRAMPSIAAIACLVISLIPRARGCSARYSSQYENVTSRRNFDFEMIAQQRCRYSQQLRDAEGLGAPQPERCDQVFAQATHNLGRQCRGHQSTYELRHVWVGPKSRPKRR